MREKVQSQDERQSDYLSTLSSSNMTHEQKVALCKERYEIVKANYKKPIFNIYDLSPLATQKKEVVQINTTTGKQIKFESIADAARDSGSSVGNISRCLNGLARQCGGFFYRYSDELEIVVKHQ